MRLLAGFVLLLALFGAAALWQSRTLAGMREQRALEQLRDDGVSDRVAAADLPAGWGLVVVGRPSGAEPVAAGPQTLPDAAPADADAASAPPTFEGPADAEAWIAERAAALPDFELEVRAGQTLSQIALDHYGRCGEDLVDRLARYNGLASPDALRAGDAILLPELERLEAGGAP